MTFEECGIGRPDTHVLDAWCSLMPSASQNLTYSELQPDNVDDTRVIDMMGIHEYSEYGGLGNAEGIDQTETWSEGGDVEDGDKGRDEGKGEGEDDKGGGDSEGEELSDNEGAKMSLTSMGKK